jgi:hypothetical protein
MLDPTDGDYPEAIKLCLIASDTDYQVWGKEEVEKVRRTFVQRQGAVPTLQFLADRFDNDKLTLVLDHFVQEKRAQIDLNRRLQAIGDPCHGCGNTENLTDFEFGIARNQKQERDWKSTGISAAVSAVTIPLLGFGAFYGPSKTSTAQLLRLQLKLCPTCINSRKGFFGGFAATEGNCALHPMWNELQSDGFKKFVGTNELKSWIQLP